MSLISRVLYFVRFCSRRTFSTPARQPPYIDLDKKLIYGGDLSTPASEESFGSLLFKRMLQRDDKDKIFQICAETKTKMTTGEFLKYSVAVGRGMKAKGVEKGDCVFLLGYNGLNLNVVFMAALLIAAVPFPVSYKLSIGTFQVLLKRMQPKLFWCEESYMYAFQTAATELEVLEPEKILVLKEKWEDDSDGLINFMQGKGEDFENFEPTKIEDCREEFALALNAITFGGPNRTVGLTHHNLNSVIARYDHVGYNSGDRVYLMVQKMFWISGIYPLLLSCAFGSTVVTMRDFRENNFLTYVDNYRVTDVLLYPSKWWSLFKYKPVKSYDLSCCKWAYAVNEIVPKELREGIKEKYGINLTLAYTLSEMSGMVFKCHFDEEKNTSVANLFPELYAKVISLTTSQPVGPNVHGELCFKGPTVSKGYIKNKNATRELFDKEGFLLSGHCGYYDENGNFYVIDRIIHQIEYKEYKISPKDLEGIIRSLSAVKDVCVTGIPHIEDGAYPIAVVVRQKREKITEAEIISYVNERVPDHKKLRGGVVFVSKIPRFRETGAIKRHLLRKIMSKYIIKDNSRAVPLDEYKAEKR